MHATLFSAEGKDIAGAVLRPALTILVGAALMAFVAAGSTLF